MHDGLTWFPFRVNRWLLSRKVMAMTAAERGAYIHLLAWQWKDGELPADPAELEALCGHPMTPMLQACFKQCSATSVRNDILHKMRQEALVKSDKNYKRAQKAAQTRWSGEDAKSMPQACPEQCIEQGIKKRVHSTPPTPQKGGRGGADKTDKNQRRTEAMEDLAIKVGKLPPGIIPRPNISGKGLQDAFRAAWRCGERKPLIATPEARERLVGRIRHARYGHGKPWFNLQQLLKARMSTGGDWKLCYLMAGGYSGDGAALDLDALKARARQDCPYCGGSGWIAGDKGKEACGCTKEGA